jgi:hypothetical protein
MRPLGLVRLNLRVVLGDRVGQETLPCLFHDFHANGLGCQGSLPLQLGIERALPIVSAASHNRLPFVR